MKKVLVMIIALVLLVGCDKPGNIIRSPEPMEKPISYYDMLELLGMSVTEVKEKNQDGDDMHILYSGNEYSITMYDNFDRVVCMDGKDKFVMYADGEVKLSYDEMAELIGKKFLVYKLVRDEFLKQFETAIVDMYEPEMVSLVLKEDGKSAKEVLIEFSAYVEGEGRINFKATFDETGMINFE